MNKVLKIFLIIFGLWLLFGTIIILLQLGGISFKKVVYEEVNVIGIKENSYVNSQGYIDRIVFTIIVDSSTPIPDGEYLPLTWWGVESIESGVGIMCPVHSTNQTDSRAIVLNNKFNITLGPGELNEMKERNMNGPYLVQMQKSLVNDTDKKRTMYNLSSQEYLVEVEELCEDDPYSCENFFFFKTKEYDYNDFIQCYDDDWGLNLEHRGITYGPNPIDDQRYKREDHCLDEILVNEYYCNEEGYAEGKPISCNENEKCLNGFCVAS